MGPNAALIITTDSANRLFQEAINVGFITSEKLAFKTKVNFGLSKNKQPTQLIELLSNWKHFTRGIASGFMRIEYKREKDVQTVLINVGIPGLMYINHDRKTLKFINLKLTINHCFKVMKYAQFYAVNTYGCG
jgi:hypothetical protein